MGVAAVATILLVGSSIALQLSFVSPLAMKLESIGLLDTFFDKDLFEGSCLEVIPAIIVEWDNTDIGVID